MLDPIFFRPFEEMSLCKHGLVSNEKTHQEVGVCHNE